MKLKEFIYLPNFISKEEESELITALSNLPLQEVKMYGMTAKRKVMHYGLDYTYNSRTVTPTTAPPPFIVSLIKKSAVILDIQPEAIVETLITLYPIGAGIGWHKDAPIFGNKIFGISLGSECILKLRKKTDDGFVIIKKTLEPRSAYILSDDVRWVWQHSIPPVKQLRYSITFRMKNSA